MIKTDKDEVIATGRQLFSSFLEEEITKEGLENPLREDVCDHNEQLFREPKFSNLGKELKLLAEDFARSKERKRVLERAGEVKLEDVTKDNFLSLLEELFCGGVTRTRIIVLFFFCSDVAIRALKNKPACFTRLVAWALIFITERICKWVQEHGGWGKVLRKSFDLAYKTSVIILGIAIVVSVLTIVKRRYF